MSKRDEFTLFMATLDALEQSLGAFNQNAPWDKRIVFKFTASSTSRMWEALRTGSDPHMDVFLEHWKIAQYVDFDARTFDDQCWQFLYEKKVTACLRWRNDGCAYILLDCKPMNLDSAFHLCKLFCETMEFFVGYNVARYEAAWASINYVVAAREHGNGFAETEKGKRMRIAIHEAKGQVAESSRFTWDMMTEDI